jgi:hypothetical protein
MVLAGGTGFLGSLLRDYFTARGWQVVVLTRQPAKSAGGETQIEWDGRMLGPWTGALEGAEVLINLSGRSVNCRYHAANRNLIISSRLETTRVLREAIAACQHPPAVWLNSSTATIYRHTVGPAWDEDGEIGATLEAKDAFSVDVATTWEAALAQAITPRTRKVALRSAMVLGLSPNANNVYRVLRKLVRWGLGGRMGHGQQFVSWIHEADFCRAVEFIVEHEELSGPVNLAAPQPLSNEELMRVLRDRLGIPRGLPATRWMLEVGALLLRTETELILKSRRVVPGRLVDAGFQFQHPSLAAAVTDLETRLEAGRTAKTPCHGKLSMTSTQGASAAR